MKALRRKHRAIVRDKYLKTLDIALAMSEQNRLKELKRQEEERKAREAERKTAEARENAIRTARESAGTTPMFSRPATEESPRKAQPDAQTTEGNDVSQPAQNPFANPPKEKRYKASFTVVDTMDKILAVKKFMVDNGVHFEKGVE